MRCAATVAVLALATTGCGGEKKAAADPERSAPSSSATATATASASASASPTAKPQPRSTTGATYDILNWDEYADDPAVLAWKKTLESLSGSLLRGKLLPYVRKYTNDKMFRLYTAQLETGLDEGWKIKRVAQVHVESSRGTTSKRPVQICTWGPTASLFHKDGTPLKPVKPEWSRQMVNAQGAGDRWRISDLKYVAGVCKG